MSANQLHRMKTLYTLLLFPFLFASVSCTTSDRSLRGSGKSEAYISWFHDGRHSGMAEAGNSFEHVIRDGERFDGDKEYREGWLAGQSEGVRIQTTANKTGAAIAGAAIQKEVDEHSVDKAAENAVKNIDTKGLEQLEK